MKNFKKILFILICILVAFIGGMFFMNKQTEPEITSTLIQNRIEQASDLVTTKYHYTKVGKFENSLNLNGWSIPLTNKYFILTYHAFPLCSKAHIGIKMCIELCFYFLSFICYHVLEVRSTLQSTVW